MPPADHPAMPKPSRRAVLTGAAATAAAVLLPAFPQTAVAAPTRGDATPRTDPHPDAEPSGTHVRSLNGVSVAFAYGHVIPSFDGWSNHSPTRNYLHLDGAWKFRFDPKDVGRTEGWYRRDLNDSTWQPTQVPGTWDLISTPGFPSLDGTHFGEGTAFTDGYGWYRRTIVLGNSWHGRIQRIHFLGVGYSADVWFDGFHLGKHEGAGGPFAMTIPEKLCAPGNHVLAVRAFRSASYLDYATNASPVTDDLAVPYKPVDYWPYAGIYRPVWLEGAPAVSISKLLMTPTSRTVRLDCIIENQSSNPWHGTIRVREPGWPTRDITVPAGSAAAFSLSRPTGRLTPWTRTNPALHRATTILTDSRRRPVDSLATQYGIREIGVEGGRLLLNGDPVFLKGMNWHEETAQHGRAMTIAEYRHEFEHMKTLGVDLIRNCVYGRHPYVYEWADRNGVLILDDLETMWLNTRQEKLQTDTYGLTRAMAVTAAWIHHNHPSVALWGLQNESEMDAGSASVYTSWLRQMKEAIRSVDTQKRPVTWASSSTDDPAFDLADVIGFNEYFGYFYGATKDLGPAVDAVASKHPGKPILITENGSWSIAGTHGSPETQGTEEWHASYLKDHWSLIASRQSTVCGYCFWGPQGLQATCRLQPAVQWHLDNGIASLRRADPEARIRRLPEVAILRPSRRPDAAPGARTDTDHG